MNQPPSVDYHPILIESLRDPLEAAAYLNVALSEGDEELLMLAIKNVAEAQGGMEKLAECIRFIAA